MNPEMDKARLLARLHTGHDFFSRALAGFAPEQMTLLGARFEGRAVWRYTLRPEKIVRRAEGGA